MYQLLGVLKISAPQKGLLIQVTLEQTWGLEIPTSHAVQNPGTAFSVPKIQGQEAKTVWIQSGLKPWFF